MFSASLVNFLLWFHVLA